MLVAPAKALGMGVFLLVLMGAGGGRVVPNASAAAAATACTAAGQYAAQTCGAAQQGCRATEAAARHGMKRSDPCQHDTPAGRQHCRASTQLQQPRCSNTALTQPQQHPCAVPQPARLTASAHSSSPASQPVQALCQPCPQHPAPANRPPAHHHAPA